MSEWITACSGIYLGILIVVLLLGLCRPLIYECHLVKV